MSIFKSSDVIINKTNKEVFEIIGNLNNLKNILPKEIQEYSSTEKTCTFKLQAMPKVSLEISEKIEYSKISLIAKESQIPFTLTCYLEDQQTKCKSRLEIEVELNMMMRMMVEKPLSKLLETLSSKMKDL